MSGDQRWNHQLDDFVPCVYFFTNVDCTHCGQFGGLFSSSCKLCLYFRKMHFAICSSGPYKLEFVIHNNFVMSMQNHYFGLWELFKPEIGDFLLL